MMSFRKVVASLSLITLTQCGPIRRDQTESQSMLHFIPFRSTQGISLHYARESVFKICTENATSPEVDQRAIRSVLVWLKAARKNDDRITRNVAISCNSPHLTINMISGSGVSTARPGSANYYTGQGVGELVHELGHALVGLSDTYEGRKAGSCQSGQPQSNMCWGAYGPRAKPSQYSGLWPDDVEGVASQVKKVFADAKPPMNSAMINAEEPLDVNNPWPAEGLNNPVNNIPDGTIPQNQIYAALGSATADTSILLVSVPLNTQRVLACPSISDVNACSTSASRIELTGVQSRSNHIVFASRTSVEISPSTPIYVFAIDLANRLTMMRGLAFRPAQ